MINGSIFHLPLANKSVHTIIFSPPYYGLRDYRLSPIVIGGELDCVHEWGSEQSIKNQSRWHTLDDYIIGAHGNVGSGKQNAGKSGNQGSFCLNCNAWRGSLGLEPTPELFIEHCRIYARECWRVLRDDGTMWVNIGASYAANKTGSTGNKSNLEGGKTTQQIAVNRLSKMSDNYKPKDLIPTPWLFAIALQQDGWYLRSDIIWHKPNPMPESVTDRPTRSHEYVFLFSKSRRYFYDADAVREDGAGTHAIFGNNSSSKFLRDDAQWASQADGRTELTQKAGRNLRSVWTVPTHGFSEAHFATFPPRLIEPMIKAGTSGGGVCVECGDQFERVVNKILEPTINAGTMSAYNPRRISGERLNDQGSNRAAHGHKPGWINRIHALGFRPTCAHYDHLEHDLSDPDWTAPLNWPTGKAIVLDPFGGAGTTQIVASRLGRLGISVELSSEYCRMGRDRALNDTLPMLELIERTPAATQADMFNGKVDAP